MKKFFASTLICILVIASAISVSACDSIADTQKEFEESLALAGYELVFEDDFDGDCLDTTI